MNIQSAEANVAAASSSVREAQLNLGYCRMSSPIGGRIGQALVKVGNLVGPSSGQDYIELATVQQLDAIGVEIQVSSRYLARVTELIRDGLIVHVVRPGFEGEQNHPHPGKVNFIDNTIDPSTSTFLTRAEVPNPEKTLLPGESIAQLGCQANHRVGERV